MNFHVDFNDIDEQGRVAALLRASEPPLGSRAYLRDNEGNRCSGVVVAVEDDLAYVEPDWDTWATSQQRHELPHGYWIRADTLARASEGFGEFRVNGVTAGKNTSERLRVAQTAA